MPEFRPIPRDGESVRSGIHEGNWVWTCRCGFEATCLEDVGGHRAGCTDAPGPVHSNDSSTPASEIEDDLCSVCGKREGENHDLPGRCRPDMVTLPARDQIAALRAEVRAKDVGIQGLKGLHDLAVAEVERMRPVVEACEEMRDDPLWGRMSVKRTDEHTWAIARAVDAYRAAPSGDGRESVASEQDTCCWGSANGYGHQQGCASSEQEANNA